MRHKGALALKIKNLFDQKNCRGVVTFLDQNGGAYSTSTGMDAQTAIELLAEMTCDLAKQLNVAPSNVVGRIRYMIQERGQEIIEGMQQYQPPQKGIRHARQK